jgi:hypothetical protein
MDREAIRVIPLSKWKMYGPGTMRRTKFSWFTQLSPPGAKQIKGGAIG